MEGTLESLSSNGWTPSPPSAFSASLAPSSAMLDIVKPCPSRDERRRATWLTGRLSCVHPLAHSISQTLAIDWLCTTMMIAD